MIFNFCDLRFRINKCNNCPVKNNQREQIFVPFEYKGKFEEIDIMFVGEVPGEKEAINKRPFFPLATSGEIIRYVIGFMQFPSFAIGNIVCCRTVNKNGKNRTPYDEEAIYCSDHVKFFINEIIKPKYVFLLGRTAAYAVLPNDFINDRTITKLTESTPYIDKNNRIYAANFHPRHIASNGGIKGNKMKEYLQRFINIKSFFNQDIEKLKLLIRKK